MLGPPDIEERIGLSGGHIFQGEALPGQMWDRRLEARTPVEGLYLCGAATHPGGSVIALNGRIAAMQVLRERRARGRGRDKVAARIACGAMDSGVLKDISIRVFTCAPRHGR